MFYADYLKKKRLATVGVVHQCSLFSTHRLKKLSLHFCDGHLAPVADQFVLPCALHVNFSPSLVLPLLDFLPFSVAKFILQCSTPLLRLLNPLNIFFQG